MYFSMVIVESIPVGVIKLLEPTKMRITLEYRPTQLCKDFRVSAPPSPEDGPTHSNRSICRTSPQARKSPNGVILIIQNSSRPILISSENNTAVSTSSVHSETRPLEKNGSSKEEDMSHRVIIQRFNAENY